MEDSGIIALYRERDERAIAETAKKYGGYCTAIAANILHDHLDVEECVNDAYFRLWSSIPPSRPKACAAFLGRITRNTALDRYKLLHAEKRGGGETELLDEIGDIVFDSRSIEQEAEHKELVGAINDFLAKNPVKKRRIFTARYFMFKSVPEISACYGISESGVSVTLNRMRKKLREYLEKSIYAVTGKTSGPGGYDEPRFARIEKDGNGLVLHIIDMP